MGNLKIQSPLFSYFLLVHYSVKLQLQSLHLYLFYNVKRNLMQEILIYENINAINNCSFTLVKTWKKVDFELPNSPFWGFSTKILLLQRGFPLTRFFQAQKTALKEECLYQNSSPTILILNKNILSSILIYVQ